MQLAARLLGVFFNLFEPLFRVGQRWLGLSRLGWFFVAPNLLVFGLFTLPHLLPQSDTAFEILSRVHMLLGLVMAVVIAAHAGGALMHGFLKRDGVLQRMLPAAMAQWLDKHQARGGRA